MSTHSSWMPISSRTLSTLSTSCAQHITCQYSLTEALDWTYEFGGIGEEGDDDEEHDHTRPWVRERLLFFQTVLVVFELVRRILGNLERVILSGRVVQVDPRREVADRKKMLEKGRSL